jgi:hypothetical protein
MMRLLFLAVLWGLTLSAAVSQFGGETIREFDAQIEVRADGSLEVTETLLVNAEGREIKRGIYRDFPTTYRAWYGRAVVPFEVRSVKRNGAQEPWHAKQQSNGVRLYIGRADRNVPRGLHRYEIRYRTDWQLGHFPDRDELYWNVTGNGWSFIIERATATVVLPRPLPESALALEAYTGHTGEKGRDWRARVDAEGRARFITTEPLMPKQGLTIVVGWPKGLVAEPTREQHFARWAHDNPEWRAGLSGLALLLAYYLVVWFLYGRDPARRTVIPRFAPPRGVSAADARYLERMGYDDRVFAAAVVALAVKGQLRIREDDDHDYTLERPGEHAAGPLTHEEKALPDASGQAQPLRDENAAILQDLRKKRSGQHLTIIDLFRIVAAVVAQAVRGQPRIREVDGRDSTLERPDAPAADLLANDEKALLDALGLSPGQSLPLRNENASTLQGARKALKDALRKEHFKQHFVTNSVYLIPGLVASVIVLGFASFQGSQPDPLALFMLVWLSGWTFGVYALLSQAAGVWRQFFSGKWLMIVPALVMTGFSIPFVGAELFGLYILFTEGSPLIAVTMLLLIAINFAFYRLLRAPTLAGRRLLDELAGFRMYLEVAEKDDLRVRRGPERTIELFEKYLPYALALGVENAWAEQFSDILDKARATGGADAVPRWYSGTSWSRPGGGFAGALAGGLSGAIASASNPPGSSSGGGGGGGGGSSGGGGGGGGGGGW